MNPNFSIVALWQALTARLDAAGETIPPLILRLIMGWEFFESGLEKLHGDNWFADIQSRFPFPFDVIPANLSWGIATWFELGGAILLWLGLGTRIFAFILLFLTFVATAAVHWPSMLTMWSDLAKGYAITDMGHGNFKLPLLFAVMLLPLIFSGGGHLSLDALIARMAGSRVEPEHGPTAWALAALVFAIPFLMLIPTLGVVLLVLAIVLALLGRRSSAPMPATGQTRR
ncbi:MAG TPA: DoxX family protein [Rhodanobacteraceae bacterium]|nr:DoxX family protein [Rhodanobacteraceae bacterium]